MNAVVSVEMPESFHEALLEEAGEAALPRWMLEAAVAEAVRRGLITGGLAGHVLGLSFYEREDFLAAHGIVRDYDEAELKAQQDAIDQVLGNP